MLTRRRTTKVKLFRRYNEKVQQNMFWEKNYPKISQIYFAFFFPDILERNLFKKKKKKGCYTENKTSERKP
jgi:hypothetical protein